MSNTQSNQQNIIGRKPVFNGQFINVEKLDLSLPNGHRYQHEIVTMRDSVSVLPIDGEGNVHLVRQYRPAIDKTILEILGFSNEEINNWLPKIYDIIIDELKFMKKVN